MKTFSQRKGLKPVSEIIQIDSISDALRNSIWNALTLLIWKTEHFMYARYGKSGIEPFSTHLWALFFKLPIDRIPDRDSDNLAYIRERFFQFQWHEVYDFIEFVVGYYATDPNRQAEITATLNLVLESEMSGYRVVAGQVVDITNASEIDMLEEALRDTRFAGVSAHLERSLELLSDRNRPDYRNSIKESISAVESMARVITGDPKATLGDALKTLEKKGKLHPALKEGFAKLYGYTSDEQGIRHAMLEEPSISATDAKFFLLSCTSFTNYLKAQL